MSSSVIRDVLQQKMGDPKRAAHIRALCVICDVPAMADAYIDSRLTPEEVKAELLEQRTERQQALSGYPFDGKTRREREAELEAARQRELAEDEASGANDMTTDFSEQ